MTNPRMPALFIGHGSPMNVITDSPERRAWEALGRALPRPTAILVVSAHWETQGAVHLTAGEHPRTIHDFGGFPDELFAIQYPAPGAPALVERVAGLLGEDAVRRDEGWGFDHGSWGVVRPMFPDADVPMIQLSLDRALTPVQHLDVAARLAVLRDEGVLLVASGNVVHNLREYMRTMGTQPHWAAEFQTRITCAVVDGDHAALTAFAPDDEAAALAINSAEHYLPLLYAVGTRLPGDDVGVFNDTIDGALTMTSYLIGDTQLLTMLG
ncbi:MAG: 4,5-DOPA dioxygenase extradiol [Novosphingobium sp.]|uniref:4,5-DOPA-extradiol-dioxygenase n=1 Tax=Novosphingobium sp. TaxID=1874826 RepID=UPI0032B81B81